MKQRLIVSFALIGAALSVHAQVYKDTLALTLDSAQARFLRVNLALAAQHYNIDIARANTLTARLLDNPDFSVATGFYQPETHKFFDMSNDHREIALQFDQLIRTAGKRNRAISLARTGEQMADAQFFDLLRTLLYTLRNDFFTLYYQQRTQEVYRIEIESLEKTADAFAAEVPLGNLPKKDLVRIRAQLYTLRAELTALQGNIDDTESEFKLLIRAGASLYVRPSCQPPGDHELLLDNHGFATLLDSAYVHRQDLRLAALQIRQGEQNLSLQRALAVPDLTLTGGYDRLGSYVKHFNNVGLGLSVPLFNRNQGNIKAAEAALMESKLQFDGGHDQVESEVANAWIGADRSEKMLASIDPSFEGDLTGLIDAVTRNYRSRNISLLEFIDFYDSYKQNVVQLNALRLNRISNLEQINLATGMLFYNK
jgi:cobalt-zinc-cadmium efflux system outer membrane protein